MKNYLVFTAIVFLAIFLRFNNLNWDTNFHLHPDERFLTMVSGDMKIPKNIGEYVDPARSPMNPANINYKFFVYGVFPLVLNKLLAVMFNNDNYNLLTIQGRFLSGLADLFTLFFVYKIVEFFEEKYRLSKRLKYFAAFFYAIAVLPIQLSHFFAVDTFLTLFMIGSFYFALRSNIIISAVFFGLALACKITALFIFPLNLIFIFFTYLKEPKKVFQYLLILFLYFAVSYSILRLADPYLFQNSNIFDLTVSKVFVENINSLKNMTVKDMNNWFPPMVQWLNKNTILHSLVNNIVFGLGIPYFILVTFGISWIIFNPLQGKQFLKHKKQIYKQVELLIILFWVIGFFVYQSVQVTPTLRYFIFLYPFLAIFASLGMSYLIDYKFSFNGKHTLYPKIISYIFIFISILILLLWPIMFSSIYFYKHTRVEASEWIYKNLPNNSIILGESWDDPLPLAVENNYGKQFVSYQLPVVDPDTPEKWQKMDTMLDDADYYVLSSNRGWGSITTVPEKYPLMSKFYNNLLSDRNSKYKKIKEFKPFYYRFFELPNNLVDESFTVYDHPIVLIYKNLKK